MIDVTLCLSEHPTEGNVLKFNTILILIVRPIPPYKIVSLRLGT